MRKKIITNKIRCKSCNDVIESKTVHDFKRCKCGNVCVDGGKDYLRRVYSGVLPEDAYEDLSKMEK